MGVRLIFVKEIHDRPRDDSGPERNSRQRIATRTHGMTTNPAPHRTNRPQRALLVDDDKLMLAVMGDMLRDLGFNSISTANDGKAGIDAFDRSHLQPEVVLCDLNMPGSDGFQFMEQLGARRFKGGVILISGMDTRTCNSAALMARFHRLNVVAALSKPVDEASLSAAIAKLG